MIDPRKVTKFDRTPEELEEFLLFSVVVAGKGAFQQAKKLDEFIKLFHGGVILHLVLFVPWKWTEPLTSFCAR